MTARIHLAHGQMVRVFCTECGHEGLLDLHKPLERGLGPRPNSICISSKALRPASTFGPAWFSARAKVVASRAALAVGPVFRDQPPDLARLRPLTPHPHPAFGCDAVSYTACP